MLNIYSFLMTAAVNSDVVAEPPMSAVLTFPSLMTSKVALAMLFAIGSSLKRMFHKITNRRQQEL